MLLRLGGSSWEVNIDPKRLQERMNNNFEEDRTRRGEKKDNKNDKKRSKEVTPIIDESLFGAQGSQGRTTSKDLTNIQLTISADLTRPWPKARRICQIC